MEIRPFSDEEGIEIRDSRELAALTVELHDLLDGLELPRATAERLEQLVEEREREAARLAFAAGVRMGDALGHVVGRLKSREPKPTQQGGNDETEQTH